MFPPGPFELIVLFFFWHIYCLVQPQRSLLPMMQPGHVDAQQQVKRKANKPAVTPKGSTVRFIRSDSNKRYFRSDCKQFCPNSCFRPLFLFCLLVAKKMD